MHLIINSRMVGVAAGKGSGKVEWRPLVKSAFKQGILLSRRLQSASAALRREAKQLVDDARAELDAPVKPPEGA